MSDEVGSAAGTLPEWVTLSVAALLLEMTEDEAERLLLAHQVRTSRGRNGGALYEGHEVRAMAAARRTRQETGKGQARAQA